MPTTPRKTTRPAPRTRAPKADRNELLKARLKLLSTWTDGDPFEDGTVLQFVRRFPGGPDKYTYVAIRTGGAWFLSKGRGKAEPIEWDDMLAEHLAVAVTVEVATQWQTLF